MQNNCTTVVVPIESEFDKLSIAEEYPKKISVTEVGGNNYENRVCITNYLYSNVFES